MSQLFTSGGQSIGVSASEGEHSPSAGEPVPPKGDQSWVFIGRTDVEAETPILWPHDAES